MYGHASWLAQAHAGYRLMRDDDYSPAAREEYADDPEPCDGSGEIHGNTSRGYPLDPQNDVSWPCPGCENCEPDDDHTNGQKLDSPEAPR
jgi:hypothetical protein